MSDQKECTCNWCPVHGIGRLFSGVWWWLCNVWLGITMLPFAVWKAITGVFTFEKRGE